MPRWPIDWQEQCIGYITWWLLRGKDRATIRDMIQKASGYPDLTDSEYDACYTRALRDANASLVARSCTDDRPIRDCYQRG